LASDILNNTIYIYIWLVYKMSTSKVKYLSKCIHFYILSYSNNVQSIVHVCYNQVLILFANILIISLIDNAKAILLLYCHKRFCCCITGINNISQIIYTLSVQIVTDNTSTLMCSSPVRIDHRINNFQIQVFYLIPP